MTTRLSSNPGAAAALGHRLPRAASLMLALAAILLAIWTRAAPALEINRVTLTDVTPSGFTLIGAASGPAQIGVRIYADAAGSQDISHQLHITQLALQGGDPALTEVYQQDNAKRALAERIKARGLLRIRIDGAAPDTAYWFHMLADDGSEQAQWPAGAPASLTTPGQTGFLSANHQLLVSINDADPEAWLIRVETDDSAHPVAAVVGDGAAVDQAVLALGNLMAADGTNWQPSGNETLRLTLERGDGREQMTQVVELPLTADFSVASIHPVTFAIGSGPSIALIAPARPLYSKGEDIVIGWEDAGTDPNALIDLYLDDNDTGADGNVIVTGLPAEPDGNADRYDWNTLGVADGIYWLYATIRETAASATAYALAPIAIDRDGNDADADSMADLWEELYFGDPGRDGSGDLDADGEPDAGEFALRTDPGQADLRLMLRSGMNLVALPMDPGLTAFDLAERIGPNLIAIAHLDPNTQAIERVSRIDGQVQGLDFQIQPYRGLIIEMTAAADLTIAGIPGAGSIDLVAGQHLIGLRGIPAGLDAAALLAALGGPGIVAAIRRYIPAEGRFETLGYDADGNPAGSRFALRRGEAYFISLHQPVAGFALP
ncbi:MAG: hypothetical protein N838_24700 [Thiohalocapsa sp. PB-PSB1]|nr:MAG: hypothetical protein N838_24700 [Thiohalocapsa sp. PB-PSB1]